MPQGIRCPSCGSDKGYVAGTGMYEKKFLGVVMAQRRRECENCGHAWFTVELNREQLEKLIERSDRADEYDTLILSAAKERLGKMERART